MKLTFLGATKTVTGSKYLVESNGTQVLVDCGLFQGLKELRLRNWEPLPIAANEIDAVVLTHAHIDHSGYLPLLVKQGFIKKIYCTPGTYELCRILLPDSGHLHEEDAEYANRKGFSKHHPAKPLYTEKDAVRSLEFFHPMDYEKSFSIANKVTCRFSQAGHILGASIVTLSNKKTTLVFSGDLGRANDLIMLPPRWIKSADFLVLESTYGNRIQPSLDVLDQLEAAINRTVRRNGVVLIPAFAVGRAQTILYALYLLQRAGRLPNVPVYLNSPMSIDVTELLRKFCGENRLDDQSCAGTCAVAHYVQSVKESKTLNGSQGPMIIISASGMATGGRIIHHLKAFAPQSRNTIILTGFQAAGTRGARILAGEKSIKIHGQMVPVNAEIVNIENLSAHADQREILDWLSHFEKAPKVVFITHGEPTEAYALKEIIEKKLSWKCEVPDYLHSVDLTK